MATEAGLGCGDQAKLAKVDAAVDQAEMETNLEAVQVAAAGVVMLVGTLAATLEAAEARAEKRPRASHSRSNRCPAGRG